MKSQFVKYQQTARAQRASEVRADARKRTAPVQRTKDAHHEYKVEESVHGSTSDIDAAHANVWQRGGCSLAGDRRNVVRCDRRGPPGKLPREQSLGAPNLEHVAPRRVTAKTRNRSQDTTVAMLFGSGLEVPLPVQDGAVVLLQRINTPPLVCNRREKLRVPIGRHQSRNRPQQRFEASRNRRHLRPLSATTCLLSGDLARKDAMYPAHSQKGPTAKEAHVLSLSKALVGLSALAFVLAVITNFIGVILTTSEGYSRASANLALLAVALVFCFGRDRS